MSWQPVEIVCDAPAYAIVQACSTIGIERPEDVRWWEVTNFLKAHGYHTAGGPGVRLTRFFQHAPARTLVCACGGELPRLAEFRFYFDDGTESDYSLGQCRRCKTVFWHGPNEPQEAGNQPGGLLGGQDEAP